MKNVITCCGDLVRTEPLTREEFKRAGRKLIARALREPIIRMPLTFIRKGGDMTYDSEGDTLQHIATVRNMVDEVVNELLIRAQMHDASKLISPEKETFDEFTPKLKGSTYGSDEYKEFLARMKPALDHHYANNRHHPEHFEDGVEGMDLVDLIEMVCDWKAATLRHDNGDIHVSLGINATRFGIAQALVTIINNTIKNMGWENEPEQSEGAPAGTD